MLAPIVAACGGFVPMISGRGLGHTGGTLDKLSAISGYETQPDVATFRKVVREVGCADHRPDRRSRAGRPAALRRARRHGDRRIDPADRELDPVEEGRRGPRRAGDGREVRLRRLLRHRGDGARPGAKASSPSPTRRACSTTALITDMDRVLGRDVGNALEVVETVAYLKGEGAREPRLHEVVIALAGEMLALGDLAPSVAAGRARAEAALDDGRAAEKFARMVSALGGPDDFLEHPRPLSRARAGDQALHRRAAGPCGRHERARDRHRRGRPGRRPQPCRRRDRSVGRPHRDDRCRHAGAHRHAALHRPCRQRGRCRRGDRRGARGRSASAIARAGRRGRS